jgi:hypothetical protein
MTLDELDRMRRAAAERKAWAAVDELEVQMSMQAAIDGIEIWSPKSRFRESLVPRTYRPGTK